MIDYEKLGVFYLGARHKPGASGQDELVLYESRDLLTHAVVIGMTGSGKTGLCIDMLEEAAIDGIPVIAIDPKGDIGNLLLTFPQLNGQSFAPWVNAGDAQRKGQTVEQFAESQATLWREGLEATAQTGERIALLKKSCDFNIYTPGSSAGLGVSILNSLKAPDEALLDQRDLLKERIQAAATCILTLLGISADPLRSREHILLSNIISHLWSENKDVDLHELVALVQKPPTERIGALDLESFYPAKERFELSISINNILAAPGFDVWLSGEPLDIDSFLWNKDGKPRISIFSISHLSEQERMFFVTMLLNQVLDWTRSQSGTTSLRAILYMDEIFGYFPPVANPPSKKPLLTLLKQARAYGLGLVLASQNPVDIDYKGLSNAGTWFIGRLQTERDKMRVLEGLESASAEAANHIDRGALSEILSGLEQRVFLMHNVHEDGPVLFKTRWSMSYLRGPLDRKQIKSLMDPVKNGAMHVAGAPKAIDASSPVMAVSSSSSSSSSAASAPPSETAPQARFNPAKRTVINPEITQFFIPADIASFSSQPDGVFQPLLLASASLRYQDTKLGIDSTIDRNFLLVVKDGPVAVDWSKAKSIKADLSKLPTNPPPLPAGLKEYSFGAPPAALTNTSSYKVWPKEFTTWLSGSQSLNLYRSATTGLVSKPFESERDFRIRLQNQAAEKRDAATSKLREKYSPRIAALEERIRLAEQRLAAEQAEARQTQLNSAISVGATVLGAFIGRKTFSSGNLGRATTAARGMGRVAKQQQDVGRAEDNVVALNDKLNELVQQFNSESQLLTNRYDPLTEVFEPYSLPLKKTNISVRLLGIAWVIS